MIPANMIPPALGKRSDVQVLLLRWCWPLTGHQDGWALVLIGQKERPPNLAASEVCPGEDPPQSMI
jgi:hypothetical protein